MRTKKLLRCYLILAAIVVGFIMYVTLTYNNVERDCYRWDQIIKFNNGWIYEDESGQRSQTKLPISGETDKNTTYTLLNTLPDKIQEGFALCFKSDHLNVRAYVDGKEIYFLDTDEHSTISKSPGFTYVFIPLTKSMSGKIIRIEYEAVYARSSFHITELFLGEKSTILTYIIRMNIVPILICAVSFCLGLIYIIAYLIKRKTYNMSRSLLYLGMFAIPLSIWSMSETQTMQFFFKNVYALQYVTYLALALAPFPFLLYYLECHDLTESKVGRALGSYCLISSLACLVLQAFGIVDLPDTLFLVHISIALIVCFTLHHSIHSMHSKASEKFSLTRLSMIVLLLSVIVDLTRYYTIENDDYSKYIRIGFLLYLGCTGLGTILRSAQVDKENKELEQLAYVDSVTGIQNHAAFIRALELLPSKEKVGIVEIEVSELERIANELGTQAKNEIILSVTKMLERAFHSIGVTYRYSETQFVVVIKGNIQESYQNGLANLEKRLLNTNANRGEKIKITKIFSIYEREDKTEVDESIKSLIDTLEYDKDTAQC